MTLETHNQLSAVPVDEQRVLILAPVGRDGPLTARFFTGEGLTPYICASLNELCSEIERGAAAAVVTSEALEGSSLNQLQTVLKRQQPWSDIPLVVLSGGVSCERIGDLSLRFNTVTILERPMNPASLLSAVKVALRARRQQYLVRDMLRRAEEARKEAEYQQAHIEALNERIQRAMTETHHRVKNNLQIIAAMVDMRAMDDSEAVPTEEFRKLGRHIRVLAAVHELLTAESKEDGQAHTISSRAMLDQLLPMIQSTAGPRQVTHNVDDVRLMVRQGTSLALVVNELFSNAIKYGRNSVHVGFSREDKYAILEVCDDGPGFPPAFDPVKAANTGLELILHLSRWDLGGSVRFYNLPEGGGCVRITIPIVA